MKLKFRLFEKLKVYTESSLLKWTSVTSNLPFLCTLLQFVVKKKITSTYEI